MAIARLALPVPLPQVFDYTCEELKPEDVGRCARVPFAGNELVGVILEVVEHSTVERARLKVVSEILRDIAPLPKEWLELVGFTARYYHAPIGEVVSLALPPELRRARAVDERDPDPLLALTEAGRRAATEGHRAARPRAAAEHLLARGPMRASALRTAVGAASVREALRRDWLQRDELRPTASCRPGPPLTADQAAVLERLSVKPRSFRCILLHGVTGSGKTEVYLRLAERVLGEGGQVLMLVPEIALTPQLETRVCERFVGARVASLHSAMPPTARSRGFVQALHGLADIVLGTRLAVFTPLPRLGLILVDEEHDASYAQLEGVRYSARDLAVWRARQCAVPVVLGSATPSLESWQHALDGRYMRLELPRRALAAAMPVVRCIDVRLERPAGGFAPGLIAAMRARLERSEQSLVFLNRRGYAPVLDCPHCGWVSACEHCSANRVLHLAERRMRCHHCGSEAAVPTACPQCGNQDIHARGRGTQRVEEQLRELFPGARILRVDRDAVSGRRQWEQLLAQIAAGEAEILVGTQMMAKGHDFPRLTLVGVLGADASLHAADFRAPERLFQQLLQVGGRAGRAALPGEVLIQTEYPQHPLYACLAKHDFARFAEMALDERRRAGFPPFTFQAMLRADAPELEHALEFLHRAAEIGSATASPALRVFDPVPMRLVRLARRERAQLLVESARRAELQAFLTRWLAELRGLRIRRDLRWRVDVDPQDV